MAKTRKARTSGKRSAPLAKLSLSEVLRSGEYTEAEIQDAFRDALIGVRSLSELHPMGDEDLDGAIEKLLPQLPSELHDWVCSMLDKLQLALESQKRHEAEGAAFRKRFLDMTPFDVDQYLRNYQGSRSEPINVWWLAGFSGDPAMMKRMRENAKRPRPKARGRSKWSKEVLDVAESAYREWVKSAQHPHPAWNTSWGTFAKACVALIKKKTGVTVPEEKLRRSILPASRFPRPE